MGKTSVSLHTSKVGKDKAWNINIHKQSLCRLVTFPSKFLSARPVHISSLTTCNLKVPKDRKKWNETFWQRKLWENSGVNFSQFCDLCESTRSLHASATKSMQILQNTSETTQNKQGNLRGLRLKSLKWLKSLKYLVGLTGLQILPMHIIAFVLGKNCSLRTAHHTVTQAGEVTFRCVTWLIDELTHEMLPIFRLQKLPFWKKL
jgi:hypothetical protein